MINIHEKSVLVAIKMEIRKRMQKNIEKSRKMSKMDPKMGAHTRVIFWSSGSFFLCQTALGAQMAPKPPPRAAKTSPSLDFHRFFVDFGRFFDDIMWATFYLVCLISFLVTSSFHFQISGHKFKCVGVVRRGQ